MFRDVGTKENLYNTETLDVTQRCDLSGNCQRLDFCIGSRSLFSKEAGGCEAQRQKVRWQREAHLH